MPISSASLSFLSRRRRAKPSARVTPPKERPAVAPAAEAASVGAHQIEMIARSSARLAAMGPRLAALAGQMEEQANVQARHAGQIAAATAALAETLTSVVERLKGSAGNVHDVMGDIARIADQTRILSINASIEAGRAGENGRTFAVVAQEVHQLADQTRQSTHKIEERVDAIQAGVREVALAVTDGREGAGDEAGAHITVQQVNQQVRTMADTAASQREGAHALHTLGGQANTLAEQLLLSVGTFRFAVHRQAAQAVQSFLPEVIRDMPDRRRLEDGFHRWLGAHPSFELLYVTDETGRQIVDNIGWKNGGTAAIEGGYGCDWTQRPWYRGAMQRPEEICISDIYRSTATGDFCFTISAVMRTERGAVLGVLGADVNFQKFIVGGGER